jgi:hypothetical protein
MVFSRSVAKSQAYDLSGPEFSLSMPQDLPAGVVPPSPYTPADPMACHLLAGRVDMEVSQW